MRKCILIFCLVVVPSFIFSCEKEEKTGTDRLTVVTSLFPVYDFARNVGMDKADVRLLLPPGVESHSFEPRPKDIMKIADSDLFIYTSRAMEPWVNNVIRALSTSPTLRSFHIIDSSRGITMPSDGGMTDPHIWLDLSNAGKMVDNIRDGFIEKDPGNRDFYTANAGRYKARLDELDRKFRDGLSTTTTTCKKDVFVHAGHYAFGYLAKRYNIKYLSPFRGFTHDSEPTPKRLAGLSRKIKEAGIGFVYYDEALAPRVAEILASETGVGTLRLRTAHNLTKKEMAEGITFISIMEDNLKNLRIGLQCQ